MCAKLPWREQSRSDRSNAGGRVDIKRASSEPEEDELVIYPVRQSLESGFNVHA